MTVKSRCLNTFGYIIVVVFVVGSAQDACDDFDQIPEANYDRNYSSIIETERRPLGFMSSRIIYAGDEIDPCYRVGGLNARMIEIKVETVPTMKICFRDQLNGERCGEGRFSDCVDAPADVMEYTFFCDVASGCSEADVNFWVRLTSGPDQADDPEGMWCGERDSLYPQSLATLPPIFTPPPRPTTAINNAPTPVLSVLLSTVILILTGVVLTHW